MLHDDKKVIRSDFDRETADKMAPVLSRVRGHHPDPVPSLSIISTERRVQQCTSDQVTLDSVGKPCINQ